MAHIIARNVGGPRGVSGGGADTYDNLILLCPTDHKTIDKAPNAYPESTLREWKRDHEKNIQSRLEGRQVSTPEELREAVSRLLAENKELWRQFGPESEAASKDPGSNLALVWELRRSDTLVPNNQKIMNLIQVNQHLLSEKQYAAFLKFKSHATAYAEHCISPLDSYPLFPKEFAEVFE